jgi:ubiquinone/menaquinone biosynthesis C-methylase UbiE
MKYTEVKKFYDDVYYHEAVVDMTVSRHLHWLASKVEIKPKQHILDVGCGIGQWLLAAQARGAHPVGVDLSTKAIDICHAAMPQGEFYTHPAESLPFQDRQFDVVSCLGSMEHFLDPRLALDEMARVARDDAAFLFLVPNAGFLLRRLGLYEGTAQTTVHEDVRTLQEWQQLFETSNLQVVQRWRDLHVLAKPWILARGWLWAPFRAAQAMMLAVWPLGWQYQVYYLCRKRLKA